MNHFVGFESYSLQWLGVAVVYILLPFVFGVCALYALIKALLKWERRQANQKKAQAIFGAVIFSIGLIIGFLIYNVFIQN